MVDGMRCSARLAAARRVMANVSAVEGDDPATVVMGMDQHRAQITAEWIDTITGEISTARIAPPGSAATARACRSRASCSSAAISASRTLKEVSV
jgi:hypothetical protein